MLRDEGGAAIKRVGHGAVVVELEYMWWLFKILLDVLVHVKAFARVAVFARGRHEQASQRGRAEHLRPMRHRDDASPWSMSSSPDGLAAADRLAAAGEYARAHALYEKAAAARVPGAYERLCHTAALLGRDVLKCTQAALALSPDNIFLHSLDGQEALAKGLVERSAASYEKAVSLMRLRVAADVHVRAAILEDTLVNLGISLFAAGRAGEAARRLRSAISLAPQSAAAYTELARALDADASDGAIKAREHAARLSPNSAEHQLELGHALLANQRATDAAVAMQRALELAPSPQGQALALFGLGRVALVRREFGAAFDAFSKATSLVPTDAESWHQQGVAARGCYWQANGADTAGYDAEAKRAWRKAIALEPQRSASVTLLRLAPPASATLPRAPVQWSVDAASAAIASAAPARLDGTVESLRVSPGPAALNVLDTAGVTQIENVLPAALAPSLAAAFQPLGDVATSAYETTNTTLTRAGRRHVAVSLQLSALVAVLSAAAPTLHPVLCGALCPLDKETAGSAAGACACSELRIVESGLPPPPPGARAQPLHTDTPRDLPWESRALKVQLGIEAITPEMGPTEFVPGSIRSPPEGKEPAKPLPLPLPLGAANLYDTRIWHRSGANRARRPRPLYYFTVIGEGAPPAGLPYTIEPSEVGCFVLTAGGVTRRRTRRCRRLTGGSSAD